MSERLYSTFQIADLLDVPPSTVLEWIKKGSLACQRLAVGPRVTERAVRDFLDKRGADVESVLAKAARRADLSDSAPVARDRPPQASLPAPRPAAPQAAPKPVPKVAPQAPPRPVPQPAPKSGAAPQIADAVLRDGVARAAEAIHIEPMHDGLLLRLRLDGVMHEKANFRDRLPEGAGEALIDRFKGLAKLDLSRHSPQGGEFQQTIDGRNVRFRVVTFPTRNGERLVLHVADPARARRDLADLLGADDLADIQGLLAEPCGLVLVVAPGRRARSTVLRAMVGALKPRQRSVITIEVSPGPVIKGASQFATAPAAGYSQAEAVAAAASQDADVIMVEEIRDPAAAATAVELAGEGRMVLVGIPARGPGAALATFAEMCGQPGPLSAALLAVVDCRMVRKLCDHCKAVAAAPAGQPVDEGPEDLAGGVRSAVGCAKCSNTGYAGMIALSSTIEADVGLARAIRLGQDPRALESAAWLTGAKTLRAVARRALEDGVTSAAEIARVLPSRRVVGSRPADPNEPG